MKNARKLICLGAVIFLAIIAGCGEASRSTYQAVAKQADGDSILSDIEYLDNANKKGYLICNGGKIYLEIVRDKGIFYTDLIIMQRTEIEGASCAK